MRRHRANGHVRILLDPLGSGGGTWWVGGAAGTARLINRLLPGVTQGWSVVGGLRQGGGEKNHRSL